MSRAELTIHGRLSRSICRHTLPPFQRRPTADIDHRPEPPPAHTRQHGPGEAVRPEKHSLELCTHFLVRKMLRRLVDRPSGVVDQNIHLKALFLEFGNELRGGGRVVDVEG